MEQVLEFKSANQDVKKSYDEAKSMIFAIANDYASYLYPIVEYIKGGYENEFQICPLNGPKVVGKTLKDLSKLTSPK